jgi:hydrogenase maturation protein HypF
MTNPGGELLEGDPVGLCAAMLREGRIVAIKGLGGFHLACRADDDEAVARLRERKSREAKPFAVMAGSPEMARRLILLDTPEETARKRREETTAATQPAPDQILSPIETVLLDRARPIVLAPKRPGAPVSVHVAPNSACFGIMLPYTPLHHLLFAEGLGPLVMTSGNPAEEPLSCANDEALRRLSHIADAFLLHDRDIARRVDDSVVLAVSFWSAQAMLEPCSPPAMVASSPPAMVASSSPPAMLMAESEYRGLSPQSQRLEHGSSTPKSVAILPQSQRLEHGSSTPKSVAILPIRRARGFVPEQVEVPNEAGRPVLAVGGELKSAICVLSGRNAVVSEHLGELSNPAAFRNFVETIGQFKKLLKIEPEIVACDLHPDYAATRYAQRTCAGKKAGDGELLLVPVQHHHAHVVSCMAENGVTGRVIGVACDGTGYGTDGQIWGCEILVCEEGEFERAGRLCYYSLPGGDAAARDTWRPAVSLLLETFGPEWKSAAAHVLKRGDSQALELSAARLLAWKARQESGESGAGPAVGKELRVQASAWPLTSSLGRLFDAVAFLLGVCSRNRYEAEAAMSLEAQAGCCESAEPLPFAIIGAGLNTPRSEEALQLDFRPLVRALVEQGAQGRPVPEIARAFHETLVAMLAEAVDRTSRATGLKRVALSGGCFANQILLQGLWQRLAASGHEVFVHRAMPAGDGGIALGQAVIAAARNGKC